MIIFWSEDQPFSSTFSFGQDFKGLSHFVYEFDFLFSYSSMARGGLISQFVSSSFIIFPFVSSQTSSIYQLRVGEHNTILITKFVDNFIEIKKENQIVNSHNSTITYCCYYHLHQFDRATITKYHRRSSINNRSSFSQSPGGSKSKIKVLAGLFLLRPLSLVCN